MSNKLAIVLPGFRYSKDCPLLYYPAMKYKKMGYEILAIDDYGSCDMKGNPEQFISDSLDYIAPVLDEIDFNSFDEVVFIAKSVGTALAPRIEDKYKINNAVHIMLTPIDATIQYMTDDRIIKYIVSGTEDEWISLMSLTQACMEYDLNLNIISDVGHRLEDSNNLERTIGILKEILENI
ncbi:hypothetical protein [Eubacterium xylanophilum]|uniref:hypothetical protein n=1 Tax=Eubacterium xylanophilum TaxID=39497 RepID=UPI00047E5DD0|nr:hypothetical protein [Eubacterium xylanophilum]MCR5798199.1 hypothetical protein [Eubacterium sp.]